tara:strand:+ start:483 stop:803 length:321 start_codon:yes stop_codon:yes gene_type:complete
METFGRLILATLVVVLNIFLGAYTFLTLWGWFVVTTFSEYNIEPLSWVEAYGLLLVVMLLKFDSTNITDMETKRTFSDNAARALTVTLVYLFTLGLGWITFQFIPV